MTNSNRRAGAVLSISSDFKTGAAPSSHEKHRWAAFCLLAVLGFASHVRAFQPQQSSSTIFGAARQQSLSRPRYTKKDGFSSIKNLEDSVSASSSGTSTARYFSLKPSQDHERLAFIARQPRQSHRTAESQQVNARFQQHGQMPFEEWKASLIQLHQSTEADSTSAASNDATSTATATDITRRAGRKLLHRIQNFLSLPYRGLKKLFSTKQAIPTVTPMVRKSLTGGLTTVQEHEDHVFNDLIQFMRGVVSGSKLAEVGLPIIPAATATLEPTVEPAVAASLVKESKIASTPVKTATVVLEKVSDRSQVKVAEKTSTVVLPKTSTVSNAREATAVMAQSNRWAVAAPHMDLTGAWHIVVTEEFKQQYEKYLTLLGQPFLVRSVALSIISLTTEEVSQTEQGRSLVIHGRNVRGVWERKLLASGVCHDSQSVDDYQPVSVQIQTADNENVTAEAWWEEQGNVHRSWLRGVQKYGGGDFESKRYLIDDGKTLVCETTFHPKDTTREKAVVTWRFTKME